MGQRNAQRTIRTVGHAGAAGFWSQIPCRWRCPAPRACCAEMSTAHTSHQTRREHDNRQGKEAASQIDLEEEVVDVSLVGAFVSQLTIPRRHIGTRPLALYPHCIAVSCNVINTMTKETQTQEQVSTKTEERKERKKSEKGK